MLAQEVIQKYAGKVRFVVEDMGASRLGESFGIDKYPAIFVDEALVARPEDFYAWDGPATGKYLPWTDLANRRKFQSDLQRMIDIRLAGGVVASLTPTTTTAVQRHLLPDVDLPHLDGKPFRLSSLRGKPVIVEFWAPWCPHCLNTLTWLKKIDPTTVDIVAIAIESSRADIEAAAKKFRSPAMSSSARPPPVRHSTAPPPSRRCSSPTAAGRSSRSSTEPHPPSTPTSSGNWRRWRPRGRGEGGSPRESRAQRPFGGLALVIGEGVFRVIRSSIIRRS